MKAILALSLLLASLDAAALQQSTTPTTMEEYLGQTAASQAQRMRQNAGAQRNIAEQVQRGRGQVPLSPQALPFNIEPALIEQCTKACVDTGRDPNTCASSCSRRTAPTRP